MEFNDYQKFKWFYTSTGKLVLGGKNALQNETLLRRLKKEKEERMIMHTQSPGSPFSVILSDIKLIKSEDIKECAIFTAAFSKAWKQRKKIENVDIFKLSKLFKAKQMQLGTWGVKEKIKTIEVQLSLVLTIQKDKLRAVPESSVKLEKQILLKIFPGKIDKQEMLGKLQVLLPSSFNKEEILSALPSGGLSIKK